MSSPNAPSVPMCAVMTCAVTPSQLRAARSMLDWSRGELAKEAKISAETIKNIEHGTFLPKEETLKAIIETFARYGIQFVHHAATVSMSVEHKPSDQAVAFSYSGVVRVTATTSQTFAEVRQ